MNDELSELWWWAYQRGQDAGIEEPIRLHAAHPTPERRADRPLSFHRIGKPRPKSHTGAIVGRPFTRTFEKFLDGVKPMTPIRLVLFSMRPKKGRTWPLGVRIAWAIVEGDHGDPETLRAVMRHPNGFDQAALGALRRLRFDTEMLERIAS